MDDILLLFLFTCILTRCPETNLEVIKTLKFQKKNIKFYTTYMYDIVYFIHLILINQ